MRTPLYWRSGKFIYPRHADMLMHFMPLQKFSLEIAQNHSLIVALRMARIEGRKELLDSHEIAVWRHTLLTQSTVEVIAACASSEGRVIDIGGFNGINFEELKLCWKNPDNVPAYEIILTDPKLRHVFEGLHSHADWEYHASEHLSISSLNHQDTLFINQAAALRGDGQDVPDIRTLLNCSAGRIICTLRVSGDLAGGYRTTVYGNEVFIPSFEDVIAGFRQTGRNWFYKWSRTHDSAFFLPESGTSPVGFLLAYQSEEYRALGFQSIQDR